VIAETVDMFPSTIDKEDLKKLPPGAFEGEIHLIDSFAGVKKYLPVLLQEEVLGFDTETKPAFRKGHKNKLSLVQFSTRFHAFLFRVGSIGLPDHLIRLLEDENIMKVGAAVRDDLIDLKEVRRFKPAGFLDLQKYVEAFGIENKAVAKMAGIVLGIRISKSQQLSNWDADILSGPQLLYAATDAWVCYRIYKELQKYRPR
jgi:ribonuclease D